MATTPAHCHCGRTGVPREGAYELFESFLLKKEHATNRLIQKSSRLLQTSDSTGTLSRSGIYDLGGKGKGKERFLESESPYYLKQLAALTDITQYAVSRP